MDLNDIAQKKGRPQDQQRKLDKVSIGPEEPKLDPLGSDFLETRQPGDELPALPLAEAEEAARTHDDRLLVVGAGIHVKGQIRNCDRLIVEGCVEAVVQTDELHIAAGGVFRGEAAINSASVAGTTEGRLYVCGRLEIADSGNVKGLVRYSQIIIHEGGRISGDVQFQAIEDTLEESQRARA